jgi:hypothetical protein
MSEIRNGDTAHFLARRESEMGTLLIFWLVAVRRVRIAVVGVWLRIVEHAPLAPAFGRANPAKGRG